MHWSPALPGLSTCLWLAPSLLAWTLLAAAIASGIKRRGARTGDTRKLFHFAIFSAAATLLATVGLAGVNLLGGIVVLVVVHAVVRGEGYGFYEAIARESDRPRRRLHVILPMLSTALGGIFASALFGPWAIYGFVASGWGDAVGEPIGIRYGRHRYPAPRLLGRLLRTKVRSERSIEGSLAVFLATLAGTSLVAYLAGPVTVDGAARIGALVVVALVATGVEALSDHGLDNLTLQIGAAAVASWIL